MRKTNLLWGVLCAALLLPACKEEQTVLSLESLPTTTIEGYLTYDAGYRDNGNNQYVRDNEKPAANVPLRVTVGYNQYQSGAVGTKVYEGQTDGNGKYSVQIYTTLTGVMAEVNPMPFEADYGKLVEADGTQSLKTIPYYYTMSNPVTFDSAETMPGIVNKKQDKAAFSGKEVEGEKEYYNVIVKGFVLAQTGNMGGTAGKSNNQVKVSYGQNGVAEVVVIGTTDGAGAYQVNLPIEDLSSSYTITAEALACQGYYLNYTGTTSESVSGIYSAVSNATKYFSPDGFNNRTVTMDDIEMYFTPNE